MDKAGGLVPGRLTLTSIEGMFECSHVVPG